MESVVATGRANPSARALLAAITADNAYPSGALVGIDLTMYPVRMGEAHIGIHAVRTGGSNPSFFATVYAYGDYDASGTKRWWCLGDLNGAAVIDATAFPRAIPATGTMDMIFKVFLDGIAERLYLHIYTMTATTTITAGLALATG